MQYLHVQLVAKELPPLEFVREVARAANNFWDKHPNLYIAIHCAYGGLLLLGGCLPVARRSCLIYSTGNGCADLQLRHSTASCMRSRLISSMCSSITMVMHTHYSPVQIITKYNTPVTGLIPWACEGT